MIYKVMNKDSKHLGFAELFYDSYEMISQYQLTESVGNNSWHFKDGQRVYRGDWIITYITGLNGVKVANSYEFSEYWQPLNSEYWQPLKNPYPNPEPKTPLYRIYAPDGVIETHSLDIEVNGKFDRYTTTDGNDVLLRRGTITRIDEVQE
ncbi:hypothetical protein EQG49_02415 [Periweissella cryptocerci]|uniref:Uncharacterized protein n=1 Tax=Periweissella cryptocerci TaxID=2506420 RepID=A0A4P6YRV4_9LACO|nr:hypothetical protein [Periweissella cryptocerci]QBO35398.1 hypothetical protein EQG49_02415 [Periweissella cryptocerci]